MRLAILATSTLLHTTLAQMESPNIQSPNIQLPPTAAANADKVKVLFQNAYGAYKQKASGHDLLSPVSEFYSDPYNGWGVTVVDSMSTMYVMKLYDLFDEAVRFVGTIDFSKSHSNDPMVSVSQSSIRYLGGLLSAYELSQKKHPILLQKARELGDKLSFAWVGDNDVPFRSIDFTTNTPKVETSNIAEAASMLLEFNRLSSFTGNATYDKLAQKSVKHIMTNHAPLPGLSAQGIDPSNGRPVGGYITFGGGSDQYFYSILRFAMLPGTVDNIYGSTWTTAIDSAIRTLIRRSTVGDWTYLADYDDSKRIRHISSHQKCFAGGDWIVGGRLLVNETIFDIGQQLTAACLNIYSSTATGLGPEEVAFDSSDGSNTGGPSPTADEFYQQHGFYITKGDFILRPEVLQSNLYAWRTTGDIRYFDTAKTILEAISKLTQRGGGVAGLLDVMDLSQGYVDKTESFFFSGVLKYLYLTFDDPNNVSLDKYVISIPGHLFDR
ncbi:maturation of Asn-linked oligosaccharides protein [Mortierella sp. AD032]|nr:maturation of Asn-linked oligosaccharides protein [Mortierella sp. AD032]